jgi:hexulose-6-phosphate isomerase
MKFGVRNGVLRKPWDEVFYEAGRLGFDGVELDIGADYAESLFWSAEGRKEIKRMMEESGVELASVCLGVMWRLSLSSEREDIRRTALEIIRRSTAYCDELGAGFILVPITPARDEGIDPDRSLENWIKGLELCVPEAERNGVVLAVENVGGGICPSARNQMRIIEAINSPFVRAYYDFGNGLSLGNDPVEEIRFLGDKIYAIHAKAPGGTYLGEGDLDFNAVADAIREIGYDGYIILETKATDNPSEAASRNLNFLRDLFKEE